MREARAVIVGAGLAGAATAYHLARRGVAPVLLLEQERAPGMHSSGRNAAMVRQVVSDPAIAALAREGARAIGAFSSGRERLGFQAGGSLLLASLERAEFLEREMGLAREAGLGAELWSRAQAAARVPVLEGAEFDVGCYCLSDGVVDVAGLLQCYLRGAREGGAELVLGSEVSEVITRAGRVAGIRAGDLEVAAPVVVDAAGAWAAALASRAGASPIPLTSLRRHLMFTGALRQVSREWPFVWNVSHEVYFRPESDGLLLSPCDATEAPPGVPETDPAAAELLHEKLSRAFPRLSDVPLARTWAGLRIFSPDGRFIIGPDPTLEGFFWAAALGGHGVTTSSAVGALAADLVMSPERDASNPFSPGRFAR